MPRGPRKSVPANRTDLLTPSTQPVALPTGLTYGEGQQLQQAQQQAPLPQAGNPPVPQSLHDHLMGQAQAFNPPPLTGLAEPTQRPNEPVTAGLPTGPGAGPEALGTMAPTPDPVDQARALYAKYPSPELLTLIRIASQPQAPRPLPLSG